MAHRFDPGSTLILRNPVSGRASTRARAARLEERLRHFGYEVRHTDGPGRAGPIAAAWCRETENASVVVIGGDGTIFETIADLPTDVPLGFFPTGTVNLLARALQVPTHIDAFMNLLERGSERRVYFARCNDRPFASVGSVGLDAETLRDLNPRMKKLLQEAAIGLKAFERYFRHELPRYRVTLDGKLVEGPLLGVIFGLQPYYGGPRRILPDADPGRPELDVGLMRGSHRRRLWRYTAGMLTGRLQWGPELCKARRLRIETDPPTAVQLDGDYFGQTPIEIEVEPQPRSILAPTNALPARASGGSE